MAKEGISLTELAREFAGHDLCRKRLKKESEAAGKLAAKIQGQLLERMAEEGVPTLTLDTPEGTAKIRIDDKVWASAVGDVSIAQEFTAMGMEEYVSVNATKLSGWVRTFANEFEAEEHRKPTVEEIDACLPEGMRGKMKIERRIKVVT